MIDDYKLFVNGMNERSTLKIFIKKLMALVEKDKNSQCGLHSIYLHDFLDYSSSKSNYNLNDLLFGDFKTINLIHHETKGLKFKKEFSDPFNISFERKYKYSSSHHLLNSFKSFVCEYCETQFTYKFKSKKKVQVSADIDHIISRKNNPLLAFSYNNFAVSCSTCNSRLKGGKSYSFSHRDDILKPGHFRLKINYESLYKISKGVVTQDDFDIVLSNLGTQNKHLHDLEIINRILVFKKTLAKYINRLRLLDASIQAEYVSYMLKHGYDNGDFNIQLYSDIYRFYATSTEIDWLLKNVKHAIKRDIENFTFELF